jgi:hypothetical protein
MFDDLWVKDGRHHRIPSIPFHEIPRTWYLDRSYDYGSSSPFSVGWWAESDGTPWRSPDGRSIGGVPGDLVRLAEWYGWNGQANTGLRMDAEDQGRGIREREEDWGIRSRVHPGAADPSIFNEYRPDRTFAGDMAKEGIYWEEADNSRVQGWGQMRKYLKGSIPNADGMREKPGMFICERCDQFIRTIPTLGRSEKDPDDADTDDEDHIADETRYRCRHRRRAVVVGRWK